MTTTKKILGAVLFLCSAMCGGQSTTSATATGQSDITVANPPIELRMRGDNAGTFTSVALTTHSVQVWADGVPLAVTLAGTHMNLANTGQAWLFATFTLPPAATDVRVEVALDNPGSYVRSGSPGSIDLYELPISLDVQASQLRARHKLVMHDDLSRSFTPQGAGLLFLPDLLVKF